MNNLKSAARSMENRWGWGWGEILVFEIAQDRKTYSQAPPCNADHCARNLPQIVCTSYIVPSIVRKPRKEMPLLEVSAGGGGGGVEPDSSPKGQGVMLKKISYQDCVTL